MPENFQLYLDVQGRVSVESLDEVVTELRDRLASAGDSLFSQAASAEFTNGVDEVHAWLARWASEFAEKTDLRFMWAEMNGFDINTDRWYSDLFGYSKEIDYSDEYELSQYVAALPHSDSALTLTGMEPMQRAFEWWGQNEEARASHADAETLAQLLVECHFLQLLRDAGAVAPLQPDVTVAASAHESSMILKVR